MDITKVIMLSSEIPHGSLTKQALSWNLAYIINLPLLPTDTYAVAYCFFPFFPVDGYCHSNLKMPFTNKLQA